MVNQNNYETDISKAELLIFYRNKAKQKGNKHFDLYGMLETIRKRYPEMDSDAAKSWSADLCRRIAASIADPNDDRIKLRLAGYELARIRSRGQSLAYLQA
jgi:hypothetical protein